MRPVHAEPLHLPTHQAASIKSCSGRSPYAQQSGRNYTGISTSTDGPASGWDAPSLCGSARPSYLLRPAPVPTFDPGYLARRFGTARASRNRVRQRIRELGRTGAADAVPYSPTSCHSSVINRVAVVLPISRTEPSSLYMDHLRPDYRRYLLFASTDFPGDLSDKPKLIYCDFRHKILRDEQLYVISDPIIARFDGGIPWLSVKLSLSVCATVGKLFADCVVVGVVAGQLRQVVEAELAVRSSGIALPDREQGDGVGVHVAPVALATRIRRDVLRQVETLKDMRHREVAG
jgi:hypothetical protein